MLEILKLPENSIFSKKNTHKIISEFDEKKKVQLFFVLKRFEKVYLNNFHLIHVNLMKIFSVWFTYFSSLLVFVQTQTQKCASFPH